MYIILFNKIFGELLLPFKFDYLKKRLKRFKNFKNFKIFIEEKIKNIKINIKIDF